MKAVDWITLPLVLPCVIVLWSCAVVLMVFAYAIDRSRLARETASRICPYCGSSIERVPRLPRCAGAELDCRGKH